MSTAVLEDKKEGKESREFPKERRCDFKVEEFRVEKGDDGKKKLRGYAAVFGVKADIGWFDEIIEPGAFAETIKEDDIRALWNHNPDYVLGRSTSGTLTLKEDKKGLYIEIEPPETTFAQDLMTSIERGDIDQMSFGFWVVDEASEIQNERELRILKKVRLFDVSPVTFPAYKETEIWVRSLIKKNTDPKKIVETLSKDLTANQFAELRKEINSWHAFKEDAHDSHEPSPCDNAVISEDKQKELNNRKRLEQMRRKNEHARRNIQFKKRKVLK